LDLDADNVHEPWNVADAVAATLQAAGLTVDRSHLRKTLHYFPQRLLLLVHGHSSLNMADHEEQQKRLKVLRSYCSLRPAHRPRILLIASDLHHEDFLREQWGLERRPGPKVRQGR
jgi:hypothetical protein